MTTIEWYDNRRTGGEMYISTDVYQRLYLSAALQRELGCVGKPIKLFVGYDKVNKRIAIGKPDVVRLNDSGTLSFDGKRHYASGRGFMNLHGLPNDKTYRYVYDGKDKTTGALLFKLENYDAPDSHNRGRRGKSGNE